MLGISRMALGLTVTLCLAGAVAGHAEGPKTRTFTDERGVAVRFRNTRSVWHRSPFFATDVALASG